MTRVIVPVQFVYADYNFRLNFVTLGCIYDGELPRLAGHKSSASAS